jgi:large subunit ribosomal protein L35
MPKLKTHRGAAKRFKITGKGKIKRKKACRGHLLTGKSSRRMRRLRNPAILGKTEAAIVKRLLPYG